MQKQSVFLILLMVISVGSLAEAATVDFVPQSVVVYTVDDFTPPNGLAESPGEMLDLSSVARDPRQNAPVATEKPTTSVPLPAAVWLFGSAVAGFVIYTARRRV